MTQTTDVEYVRRYVYRPNEPARMSWHSGWNRERRSSSVPKGRPDRHYPTPNLVITIFIKKSLSLRYSEALT
jgi:hypothetical protein